MFVLRFIHFFIIFHQGSKLLFQNLIRLPDQSTQGPKPVFQQEHQPHLIGHRCFTHHLSSE